MNPANIREKLKAFDKITSGDSTTIDKVESLVTLLKGIDPRIDKKLADLPKQLSNLKNLQEGDVIELALEVRTGPDCTNSPQQAPHYHAKNGQFVRATDGTIIQDPGSCAFGKVNEVQIEELETSKSTGGQETPSHTNPSLF